MDLSQRNILSIIVIIYIMQPYEFRPEVAIADSAFYAYGKNYQELFENACLAVTESMVDSEKIEEKIEKKFDLKADSLEKLLYEVLEEVIYLKDAKQLVFGSFEIQALKSDPPCSLSMVVKGEKIDRHKHQAHGDVKAVTYQDFGIEKMEDGFRASVTLDI